MRGSPEHNLGCVARPELVAPRDEPWTRCDMTVFSTICSCLETYGCTVVGSNRCEARQLLENGRDCVCNHTLSCTACRAEPPARPLRDMEPDGAARGSSIVAFFVFEVPCQIWPLEKPGNLDASSLRFLGGILFLSSFPYDLQRRPPRGTVQGHFDLGIRDIVLDKM